MEVMVAALGSVIGSRWTSPCGRPPCRYQKRNRGFSRAALGAPGGFVRDYWRPPGSPRLCARCGLVGALVRWIAAGGRSASRAELIHADVAVLELQVPARRAPNGLG